MQNRSDALTIIQLSSRIHRIRRKKNKYHPARGAPQFNNSPHHTGGSNVGSSGSGLEPSSSEMSADTVIYLGPCNNDETDGEHPPPVILPNLSYKGNQCTIDVPENYPKPQQHLKRAPTANSPRSVAKPEKHQPVEMQYGRRQTSSIDHKYALPAVAIPQRKLPQGMIHADHIVMEQWVDGPKMSRSKISEARHLKREVNRTKNEETWIDGPKLESKIASDSKAPQVPSVGKQARGYGFMDTHKKTMIRKWVENQTTEVLKISTNQSAQVEWQVGVVSEIARQPAGSRAKSADEDDQDSGPSDVPPALPLIDQSKSSKNSEMDFAPTYPKNNYMEHPLTQDSSLNDFMPNSHPLSALSFGNMSTVSSFHFEDVRIQQGDLQGISK